MSIFDKAFAAASKLVEKKEKAPKKKAENKKAAKKVENTLTEAQTEELTRYFNMTGRDSLDGRRQRALIQIIEEKAFHRLKTTSCGRCWRSNHHGYLVQIADQNGIENNG